jgi:hypothetical protein
MGVIPQKLVITRLVDIKINIQVAAVTVVATHAHHHQIQSLIRPYLHRRPFSSKLISLLMFIDAIPRQDGLISLAAYVLPDEEGPQHEEHNG